MSWAARVPWNEGRRKPKGGGGEELNMSSGDQSAAGKSQSSALRNPKDECQRGGAGRGRGGRTERRTDGRLPACLPACLPERPIRGRRARLTQSRSCLEAAVAIPL